MVLDETFLIVLDKEKCLLKDASSNIDNHVWILILVSFLHVFCYDIEVWIWLIFKYAYEQFHCCHYLIVQTIYFGNIIPKFKNQIHCEDDNLFYIT